MYKYIRRKGKHPILIEEKDVDFNGPIKSKQDVRDYIHSHKKWWTFRNIHFFTDNIDVLIKEPELRAFFLKQIDSLRKELGVQSRIKQSRIEKLSKRRKVIGDNGKWAQEPGDIYGNPQFYRYGEGGRSHKKRRASGFMKGE